MISRKSAALSHGRETDHGSRGVRRKLRALIQQAEAGQKIEQFGLYGQASSLALLTSQGPTTN
jgi:hypothetical protein